MSKSYITAALNQPKVAPLRPYMQFPAKSGKYLPPGAAARAVAIKEFRTRDTVLVERKPFSVANLWKLFLRLFK